jgi:hypothetical protein
VWRYAQPYRLVDPRDPLRFKTLWFVNDELGVGAAGKKAGGSKVCHLFVAPSPPPKCPMFSYVGGRGLRISREKLILGLM